MTMTTLVELPGAGLDANVRLHLDTWTTSPSRARSSWAARHTMGHRSGEVRSVSCCEMGWSANTAPLIIMSTRLTSVCIQLSKSPGAGDEPAVRRSVAQPLDTTCPMTRACKGAETVCLLGRQRSSEGRHGPRRGNVGFRASSLQRMPTNVDMLDLLQSPAARCTHELGPS